MKRRFACLAAAFLCALPLFASPTTADLWPAGQMPGLGSTAAESVVTEKNDGILRITHVSVPTLTFFPAPDASAPRATAPALIVCPGGAYKHLAIGKEGTDVAAWLNEQGFSAFVLKYRVPANREGSLQDIQRALRLVRARAAEWSVDAGRVGVLGFSAGGHLAASSATSFAQPAYAPLDAIDEQSARPDFAILVYPAYLDRDGALAPELKIPAAHPPALLVHSEDDKRYVAGSRLYAAALAETKIDHHLILYPTGGHGYGLRSRGDARAWPDEARSWLSTFTHR